MKFKFYETVTCNTTFHDGAVGIVVANCANQYRIRFNIYNETTGKFESFYDDTIEEVFLERFERSE